MVLFAACGGAAPAEEQPAQADEAASAEAMAADEWGTIVVPAEKK
jgi:hypothetical protein